MTGVVASSSVPVRTSTPSADEPAATMPTAAGMPSGTVTGRSPICTGLPSAPKEYNAALNARLDGGTAGDLVTCREWPEAWLNEGFATYFSMLCGERYQGLYGSMRSFMR